jgi:DNA-binding transcriptional ArsR family regulator
MTTDLLSTIRGEIDARLRELRPLVDEYERLLAGGEALGASARASARAGSGASARSGASAGASPTAPTTQVRRRSPGRRGSAAGAIGRVASASSPAREAGRHPAKSERAPRGAAQAAILAALEHGSHTVGELVVVTAMSGASLRESLRRLRKAGTVTPAKRDGKAAYTLSGAAEL